MPTRITGGLSNTFCKLFLYGKRSALSLQLAFTDPEKLDFKQIEKPLSKIYDLKNDNFTI